MTRIDPMTRTELTERRASMASGSGPVAVILLILALGITASGCRGPQDSALSAPSGTLSFRVLPSGQVRGVLEPRLSSQIANVYEVFILKDGQTLSKTVPLSGDSSTIAALEPGDYLVLVLGGYRRSTTSSTAMLLGSAASSGFVQVLAGERSELTLVLKAVDFTFEPDSSIVAGTNGFVRASGASFNPYVGMSLSGTSTADRPRLKSTALWNGYRDFPSPAGSETAWSAELGVTAPASSGPVDIQFQGASVTLVGCGAASGSLSGRSGFTWKWLNRYDMGDPNPLAELVEKSISIVPPSTGLGLSIGWQ